MSSNLFAQGGCLCGQVRYQLLESPEFQYLCHCRDCQRISGSAYLPLLAVPLKAFQCQGKLSYFSRLADSGRSAREAFCPRCGSRLFGDGDGIPGLVVVTAGTLDRPELFQPQAHIHTRALKHWDIIADGLPCHEQEPPG